MSQGGTLGLVAEPVTISGQEHKIRGAVLAANAVVVCDVADHEIVEGMPAVRTGLWNTSDE